ncbi:methylated-DNA--[protein]-cysteine S-methyltransferase [Bdellovibrio sp. SKB1291214]|uniref:methylated-DNA--[protein]-cysteine S-methyltransferase n=1 Tax=Bdellovibrio sp. SKB1291214 TaxID=1732569 RepID=UPI000B514C59|nr:methylated-DNA--[protein]-cysteine S-methyltransferase [Bdellovibrio sp. SKB1291214]UYL07392.1 methylated-DNA--[protein]-cysteine S-methyltransferase [Bdellovibrio sp. SKB1291214]
MIIVQRKFQTKVGPLFLVASEMGLRGLLWKEQKDVPYIVGTAAMENILDQTQVQVSEYLKGERKTFSISLDVEGTEFQKRVWAELAKIPYGKTQSYKDIATALKDANACRAVGTANGRNPVSIIVPCHRVIAASGKLAGYAGGIEVKKMLLEIEGL